MRTLGQVQNAGATGLADRILKERPARRSPDNRAPVVSMRTLTATLLTAALAACSGSPAGAATELDLAALGQCQQPAPLEGTPDPRTAGTYIVVFRDGTDADAAAAQLAQKFGFAPRHVYQHALQGFSAALSDAQLAGVRCDARVKYVAHDGVAGAG